MFGLVERAKLVLLKQLVESSWQSRLSMRGSSNLLFVTLLHFISRSQGGNEESLTKHLVQQVYPPTSPHGNDTCLQLSMSAHYDRAPVPSG